MAPIQLLVSALLLLVLGESVSTQLAPLPSLYSHYTSGGIKLGLVANSSDYFSLNGRPLVIYSGSLHYFRVIPQHWRRTLKQFKAAGLNSVQIYVPWNLHEDIPGKLDFESSFLNLDQFLTMIKEEDMFAIVRPGPYICAEWEMGGLPSWLLRDPAMKLRTSYEPFMKHVRTYWNKVFEILNRHLFANKGGPVIAVQLENEYSSSGVHDYNYLKQLQDLTLKSGFMGLMFTSDAGFWALDLPNHLTDVLEAVNVNMDGKHLLDLLKKRQSGKPGYIAEFRPGWYDSWHKEKHYRYDVKEFEKEASDSLFKANGSINYYMFIGGTNFGFMNGIRVTTSFDYDAPLSESGNYTDKYRVTLQLYRKLEQSGRMPKLAIPEPPTLPKPVAYGKVQMDSMLPLETLLNLTQKSTLKKLSFFENLPLGKDHGQRYGFVLYRIQTDKPIKKYEITGQINDRGIFLVNDEQIAVLTDGAHSFVHQFNVTDLDDSSNVNTYDMLVENLGRNHWGFGSYGDRKGIQSPLKIDGTEWTGSIEAYSLDFNSTFVDGFQNSSHWIDLNSTAAITTTPAYYRGKFTVEQANATEPADSFLLLPDWTKCSVFVNGFNLGRYWNVGPQKTLYVPGPVLKKGENRIELFSVEKPGNHVEFIDHPILDPIKVK